MPWIGKAVGRFIGSAMGPLGIAAGIAIGHIVDESSTGTRAYRSARSRIGSKTAARTPHASVESNRQKASQNRKTTSTTPERFHSKIAGVTFNGRQAVVQKLRTGERLSLIRERANPHDRNAIAVYSRAQQVGYIKRELAAKLAPKIDQGAEYRCTVAAVTGGNSHNYGVNILLERV